NDSQRRACVAEMAESRGGPSLFRHQLALPDSPGGSFDCRCARLPAVTGKAASYRRCVRKFLAELLDSRRCRPVEENSSSMELRVALRERRDHFYWRSAVSDGIFRSFPVRRNHWIHVPREDHFGGAGDFSSCRGGPAYSVYLSAEGADHRRPARARSGPGLQDVSWQSGRG